MKRRRQQEVGLQERGTLGEQELRVVLVTERGLTLLLPAGYLHRWLIQECFSAVVKDAKDIKTNYYYK